MQEIWVWTVCMLCAVLLKWKRSIFILNLLWLSVSGQSIIRVFKKFEIKRFREKLSGFIANFPFRSIGHSLSFYYELPDDVVILSKIPVHSIIIKSIASFPLNASLTFWEMKLSARQIPNLSDALLFTRLRFPSDAWTAEAFHSFCSVPLCPFCNLHQGSINHVLHEILLWRHCNFFQFVCHYNVHHPILLHVLWISTKVWNIFNIRVSESPQDRITNKILEELISHISRTWSSTLCGESDPQNLLWCD